MYHILAVEDEVWIRSAIVKMVEKIGTGFKVVGEAADGEEAWNLIHELWPTILITDIAMPQKDGLWLAQKIFEEHLPILTIIISGYDKFEYAQQAVRFNVCEYLLKPVSETDLRQALVNSLERLEQFKEMNSLLVQIQQFVEQFHSKEQQLLLFEQAELVQSILRLGKTEPSGRRTLIRIFAGKLKKLLQEIDPEYPIRNLNEDNNEAVRNFFKDLIETLILSHKHFYDNSSKLAVVKACEYINENYMNDLAVDEIANYCNLSTSYFSNLFKQNTGESFVHYLNRVRIGKAKELLMESDLKIYQVAEMSGFTSLPYFNRLFKRRVGVSPNEYRKGMGV